MKKMVSSTLLAFRITVLLMLAFQIGCSNSRIVEEGIKKHGAAAYYFEQGDYVKARKYYLDAKKIWISIQGSENYFAPEWFIENEIKSCNLALERIPVSRPMSTPVNVPILNSNNKIYVEAVLNNQEHVKLLVDTGATCSLITPKIAKKLSINPQSNTKKYTVKLVGEETIDVPFVDLAEMRIDKAVVQNLNVGVYDAFPSKPSVDGILGADFLQHFTVTIDHHAYRLTLAQEQNK